MPPKEKTAEQLAAEKAEADRVEAERLAAEKAEADRLEAEAAAATAPEVPSPELSPAEKEEAEHLANTRAELVRQAKAEENDRVRNNAQRLAETEAAIAAGSDLDLIKLGDKITVTERGLGDFFDLWTKTNYPSGVETDAVASEHLISQCLAGRLTLKIKKAS